MPDLSRLEQNFRQRFRDLNPAASHEDSDYARYMSLARAVPLGHETFTVSSTAIVVPNLPADTKRMILYSFTEDLSYTDIGAAPSDTRGQIIPKETVYVYDSDVDANFKLWAAADTEVRVAYYG